MDQRAGARSRSCPNVARWLGDIRQYFPTSVVQLMQKDALQRLDLKQVRSILEICQSLSSSASARYSGASFSNIHSVWKETPVQPTMSLRNEFARVDRHHFILFALNPLRATLKTIECSCLDHQTTRASKF